MVRLSLLASVLRLSFSAGGFDRKSWHLGRYWVWKVDARASSLASGVVAVDGAVLGAVDGAVEGAVPVVEEVVDGGAGERE